MRHLAWKVIDRLFLVTYGRNAPTDEEWAAYLQAIRQHGTERTMQVIVTAGGGPTPAQRRELGTLLSDRSVPVAVMSDSATVRAMVTAMSWFTRRLRAFPPTGLLDALAYLDVPQSRADLIEREIAELRHLLHEERAGNGGRFPS